MGCLDADTVLALLDGELSTGRTAEIESHLDDCAACRRLVSESAAVAEAPDAPAVPDRLGPYEIRGVVGRGGMGEVYRAYDPRLDRQVAIKVIQPYGRRARAEDLDWFEREVRAAAAINHANVLAVYDVGRHDGVPYVVTELLEGESLRARLARGPVALRHAVAWGCEIAQGLAAAHERGIVHRDIKPDNVFVTRDGHAKLLDFGVAAVQAGAGDELEPRGLVVGTLGYMAPEQVRGEPVDHRADVFALGAVLFEILTGQPAFQRPGHATTAIERAESSLHDDPFERTPAASAIAAPIAQVVRRCLEKTPVARFQSARDLAFALALAGDAARPGPARPRPSRWPWLAGALALAGGGAVAAWSQRSEPPRAALVTRLEGGSREVLVARAAPDGVYLSASTGDGIAIEGLGSLQVLRRTPEALVRVPHSDGALLVAAGAGSLLVLRDLERQGELIYGRLARIDRDGNDQPLGADPGIVLGADFLPDGSIAVIRSAGELFRVEAPIGKVVYESPDPLIGLRISRTGAIAFIQRSFVDTYWKSRFVTILGDGEAIPLGDWYEAVSVAWRGDELWVSGSRDGTDHGVWRFERGGRGQLVWRAALAVAVQDIAADGALVIEGELARRVRAGRPGWERERDLSVSGSSELADLSLDGRWLSGADSSDRKRTKQLFVRSLDGGDPVIVGRGAGGLLASDGQTVISRTQEPPWRMIESRLLGPGPDGARIASRELPAGEVTYLFRAGWRAPRSLLILANGPGRRLGLYEQALDDPPRRLADWPGSTRWFDLFRVSPDGTRIADRGPDGVPAVIDVATRKVTPLGRDPASTAVGWSSDGAAVWLASAAWPVVVTRHALDGSVAPQLTIRAPEPGAFLEQLRVAGDGQTYAYSYAVLRTVLYRVEVPR